VEGFLDKNKDTLFNDLKHFLETSKDNFLQTLFPPDIVESKMRPPTAGTQFRVNLILWIIFFFTRVNLTHPHPLEPSNCVGCNVSCLIEYFLVSLADSPIFSLRSCTPHYIRCIRPNAQKAPMKMDDQLTANQIRYLGLLENVRVRRAGYAYRATYEKFLHR